MTPFSWPRIDDSYQALDEAMTPTTDASSTWSSPRNDKMINKTQLSAGDKRAALDPPNWKKDQWNPTITLILQVFPAFLVAGLGMVAAGLLLGHVVKEFPVFEEVREIMILVPALLGLKGNLEMTLAARLSTHANLGDLDCNLSDMARGSNKCARIIGGNLAVVQAQAIVVGFLASLVAVAVNVVSNGRFNPEHALLLCSSAIASASIASLVLAIIMIGIVLLARRNGIDPDNVASPIAGMLGDFCTLALLSSIAQLLWSTREDLWWVQWLIIAVYGLVAPVCSWTATSNQHTAGVLKEAWAPVIISMLVSSVGGVILKHAVHNFKQLAPFAPVMNGAGGNLAAVHTSRISTSLHEENRGGLLLQCDPEAAKRPRYQCEEVAKIQCEERKTSQAGWVLIALIIPGSLSFAALIVGVRSGWQSTPEPMFLVAFMVAALLQVCILIKFADVIVARLWQCGLDPDNAAIPYVTSLGDVVGSASLTMAFWLVSQLGGQPWQGCC